MKKKKTILIIGGGLLALGWLAGCWLGDKKGEAKFTPIEVTKGDIKILVLATGVVVPQNRIEIKPSISGRAEDILVEEGQTVKKGQVLAWMSSIERATLLDAARMKGDEVLSHWEELYNPTPLMAPLKGVIISREVEPGQTVTTSDAVLVMSDRLIVRSQVDETDIGKIKENIETEITLDAYPDHVIRGTVDHIAYEADIVSNVTIYEVEILPAEVPSFMKSGMTANVTFIVNQKKDILLLPSTAVNTQDNRSFVFVQDDSSKRAEKKEIEVGMTDGKNVEVVSGLSEGAIVLKADLALLKSSEKTASNPFMTKLPGPNKKE